MEGVPKLEITFLGTGTSHGVPVINCDCLVCGSSDPRDSRTRSSILVRVGGSQIVVDTGPDFRLQCLREKITAIDAVFFTHSHTDHIMGFDDLRRFCDGRDGGLPIFAEPGVLADLRRVFAFAFDGSSNFPGYVRPIAHAVTGTFEFGGVEVVPVTLPHGRFLVTGYVFRSGARVLAAYYTDCCDVPDAAVEAARGAEILILDALRHRPHPTHMSVEQAVGVAGKIGATATYLTHMCHEISHATATHTLPSGVSFAYDGLKVGVG